MDVKATFRGWQGHLCLPCRFHLNTLVENTDGEQIIVSTVGECFNPLEGDYMQQIGAEQNAYYETMVFKAIKSLHKLDNRSYPFLDCDPSAPLGIYTEHYSNKVLAAKGHDETVLSIVKRLNRG